MPTKTSVSKVNALLNPTLEETYDPQSMIALVPIHADHKVADIGSGPVSYTHLTLPTILLV